jgi:opacity protein-like surface antigen
MKSYRVFSIFLFSLICISVNAQVFVGGNFGFNTTNNKILDGATTIQRGSNFNFALSPLVGKFLSEKFAVGVELDLSLSGSKTSTNTETETKSSSIGVSPFLRYYAIKWNKLSLFGQGNIGVELSNSSLKTGGVTNDGPKGTRLYLSIYPGLAYDITEKLSLQTSLNILSFGYTYFTSKEGTSKNNSSSFNLGAGLGNIVSVNAITIGAIYKF